MASAVGRVSAVCGAGRLLCGWGLAMASLPALVAPARPFDGGGGGCSVHWFRRGLRLHDNPALQAAVRAGGAVRCIYILDPWFAASSAVGINRWR